jgi:hypothetical protein
MDLTGMPLSRTQITRKFRQIARSWTGCDWPIQFGKLGLNLNGLKSAQATLMAGATSGEESAEWRRAAKWLAGVEHEALQAERLARNAVDLAVRRCPHEAVEAIEHACHIEAKYHDHLVWRELRDALAAHLRDSG